MEKVNPKPLANSADLAVRAVVNRLGGVALPQVADTAVVQRHLEGKEKEKGNKQVCCSRKKKKKKKKKEKDPPHLHSALWVAASL